MDIDMKIEISNGELLDKLSILELKIKNIQDKHKLLNIQKEYNELLQCATELLINNEVLKKYKKLQKINIKLWNIENNIRLKEKNKTFDQEFIDLARSVYITNDKRANIKKDINILSESSFIEEKSYEI